MRCQKHVPTFEGGVPGSVLPVSSLKKLSTLTSSPLEEIKKRYKVQENTCRYTDCCKSA